MSARLIRAVRRFTCLALLSLSFVNTLHPAAAQQDPSAALQPEMQPISAAKDGQKDIANGWPIALPGSICCTPVVADMTGDGKPCIIVTCCARDTNAHYVHPKPNQTPLVYALRLDGTVLPGWPIEAASGKKRGGAWGGWASSPSVAKINGKDQLVMVGADRKVLIIQRDLTVDEVTSADPVSNVPIADLYDDGNLQFISGRAFGNVDGSTQTKWTGPVFHNGYAPAIGDAAGDEELRVYHLFYTTAHTNFADLAGFDRNGNQLPGWPQKIDDPSWHGPVLGDVLGDGKMDVIAAYGTHLFAWDPDGKPLPNTKSTPDLNGILVDNIFAATSSPALADLDGSGKAEIIVFDRQTMSIRAWHGDGTGFGNADGIIAQIPEEGHGVSVVSLGDGMGKSAEMDFFTSHYWVRLHPDQKTEVINMLPDDEKAAVEWSQPTIADVEGNGYADVLFGLSDGRVFIYQTHLAYHKEKMQWPTAGQNFQHTGAWKSAFKH
jgi:hypothetical protein